MTEHVANGPVAIVWEFVVRPGHERAFEEAYGPQGAWATLFAQGQGFLDTQLVRDDTQPRRYLTIDRWSSAQAFPTFKKARATEYEQLDVACNELTESERLLAAGPFCA